MIFVPILGLLFAIMTSLLLVPLALAAGLFELLSCKPKTVC